MTVMTIGAASRAPMVLSSWRALAAFAGAVACAPAAVPSISSGASTAVTTPAAGIVVGVTVDHDTVVATAPLRITVTVRNTDATARSLAFTSGCATDFELLDGRDAVITTSEQMCTQVMTNRALASGDSLSEVHVLLHGRPGYPTIAPGTYRIRGVLLLASGAVRSPAIPVRFR